MKKQKTNDIQIKTELKNSGVSYSAKRQKKLKESSRYRPLGFLRKNLGRGDEHVRTAL